MKAEQQTKRQKMIARIQQFTLMDDDFMTRFFDGEKECIQEVLRILLEKSDLTVTEAKGQQVIKNLQGRSVRLDVFAKDSTGKPYDIEIQRANEGAGAQRARYNAALMDANETVSGQKKIDLPESYVIFITENDIYGEGLGIYKIDRYINGAKPFNDGSHIIYVNGKYRGNDPIGDLMYDFSCNTADKMKNKKLADKMRQLKEDENMCKIMEDFAAEERAEERTEIAEEMLKEGTLSLEKIAQYSRLPLETVKQLAERKVSAQA